MTQTATHHNHPTATGPAYRDEDGEARLILCPDCGQMEWWTARECSDHGMCRAHPAGTVCPVCDQTLD